MQQRITFLYQIKSLGWVLHRVKSLYTHISWRVKAVKHISAIRAIKLSGKQ